MSQDSDSDEDTDGMTGVESDFETGMEPMDEDVGDPTATTGSAESISTPDESQSDSSSTTPDDIPHRVRHDSPKEGRETLSMSHDPGTDGRRIDELHRLAKDTFDEKTVHLTDSKLAALRAGLDSSDEAFLDAMREIGYGYFD